MKFHLKDNRSQLWLKGEDDYTERHDEAIIFPSVASAERYCQEQQLFQHSVCLNDGANSVVLRPLVRVHQLPAVPVPARFLPLPFPVSVE